MIWYCTEWAAENAGPWDGVENTYDTLTDHADFVEQLLDQDAQVIRTKWRSGGFENVVSSPRLPGESTLAWMARHFDAVQAAQADFPPDKED